MSTSAKLRVLIAEDEVLVSMFLADLVEDAGFEVVGVARTAPDAVALAQQHRPDIALMDANLKGGASGIDAAEVLPWSATVRTTLSIGRPMRCAVALMMRRFA